MLTNIRSGTVRLVATGSLLSLALVMTACGSSDSKPSSGSSTGGSAAAEPVKAANAPTDYFGPEKGKPAGYGVPKKKDGAGLTFGYLNITSANETLNAIGKGFAAEGKAIGVKTIILDDQLKVDKQVSDFQQLLAQGVDGILVNPLDNKALAPLLKQAKAKNVPVIGMDITQGSAPLPEGYASQIWRGRDHEAFGQVKLVADAQPGAKVGAINIAQPVPGPLYQMKRVETYWAQKFGLTVLGEQLNQTDDAAGGQLVANPLLSKYPDLNAFIAYNDPSAVGAVAAARANGRKVVSVGDNGSSDGIDGVKNGILLGTFQQDSVGQGAMAILGLYDAATNQNMPLPPTILRVSKLVTKDTVSGIATWEDQAKAIEQGEVGAGL
jgi:ribose transport system substrate-binding protein